LGLRTLKYLIAFTYLVNAMLLLIAGLAVAAMPGWQVLLTMPVAIILMGFIPIAMLVCGLATTYFLSAYKKWAVWVALALASSPLWPFIVSQFGPVGIFGDSISILPLGISSIWLPIYLGVAFCAAILGKNGVLS
jgi:hypothetical protein